MNYLLYYYLLVLLPPAWVVMLIIALSYYCSGEVMLVFQVSRSVGEGQPYSLANHTHSFTHT